MSSFRQRLLVASVLASWAVGAIGITGFLRDASPPALHDRDSEADSVNSVTTRPYTPRRSSERELAERMMSDLRTDLARLQAECAFLNDELSRSVEETSATRAALEELTAIRKQERPFTTIGALVLDPSNDCGVREHFDHLRQYFPDMVDAARLTQLVVDPRFRSMATASARQPTAEEVIEIIGQEAYDRVVPVFEQAPATPYYRDLPDDPGLQRAHREYFATRGLLSLRRFAPAFSRR